MAGPCRSVASSLVVAVLLVGLLGVEAWYLLGGDAPAAARTVRSCVGDLAPGPWSTPPPRT